MGVQGFQEYLEKRCPGAAVPVDLLKLARTAARQQPLHYPHPASLGAPAAHPPPPARILIDADSGLQRLYGGYQTDWVCGGEWNAMLGYLAALSQACLYQGGLELVVIFNGTLGKDRWPEWARRAQGQRQTAQLIVNHVASKGTPPPRAWFLPPACLSHCIRLAMLRYRVRVSAGPAVPSCLSGNHILPDEDLAAFHWSLLGPEHPLASLKVRAHQLVLPPCEVVIKAVSEYVSSIKDLSNLDAVARDVFKQSQGLRSIVVCCAYLKCVNVSPSLPGCSLLSVPSPQYPPQVTGKPAYPSGSYPGGSGPGPALLFQAPPPMQDCNDSLAKAAFSDWSAPYDGSSGGGPQGHGPRHPNHHVPAPPGPPSAPGSSPSSSSDGEEQNEASANHVPDKSRPKGGWEEGGKGDGGGGGVGDGLQGNGSSHIPSLLSMATRTHMDITTPPLPQVVAEVLRVAEHRHPGCVSVCRYMMQWPGGRILQRHELDAFLAQSVSSQLYEPDQLQELKVDKLDSRGIQLAALFMCGVDTALFVNDACGQPIPWDHCCPWGYFDGKLFQSKLARATRERGALLDMCEGQEEQVSRVEKMRQAILEGISLNRQPPPPPPHRARAFPGIQAIPSHGGKLEIAGMVVGQWAGNKPVRGRGGFNVQVVSVGGGGRGRGRDLSIRGRGGKKPMTSRPQVGSTSPSSNGAPKQAEDSKVRALIGGGAPHLNGSSPAPASGQAPDPQPAPTQAQPVQCALPSRDSQSGARVPSGSEADDPCCPDDCTDGAAAALQKEE
nr:PREDICTED: constitutive coactivator of PPAR-gamma-like protein 2 [Lepisosteus oculatus]